ncbi:hypothetical protein [Marinicrinis lubricantis]|uniref:Uncharacterized protein n=1 Tax=Marinicrinis lubricantis TaxID=2086470 RepID=A0ABW1IQK1_9BACL
MKWLRKLLNWVVFTLSVSLISSAATLYAVQWYVEEQLSNWNIEWSGQSIRVGDLISGLTSSLNPISEKDTTKWVQNSKQNEYVYQENEQESSGQGTDPQESDYSQPENAVPVFGGNIAESTQEDEVVISTEDFNDTKDKISSEDKMKIFTMLFTKLPQEDIQALSSILENGITTTEMEEVKSIISEHISEQEYKEILSIIEKYEM